MVRGHGVSLGGGAEVGGRDWAATGGARRRWAKRPVVDFLRWLFFFSSSTATATATTTTAAITATNTDTDTQDNRKPMEQQQLDPDLSDAVAWFNQLILDNSALRHRLADSEHARRALALENRDLQGRLEEGRRALAMLAAHVFGENAVGSPGMEMAVVCAGAETDVDVDAGVEMEMEMETEMDAGMDAGLEQRAAPTWRSSFDEQIAWQTAQDGMWRDGIADVGRVWIYICVISRL